MKFQIKSYFESLRPHKLGLKSKIKVSLIKKLGMGANNANYLVIANGIKFIFRLNLLIKSKKKARSEFDSIKLVEKVSIAPKAWILDDTRKIFDSDFIILDYIEGETLSNTRYKLDKKLIRMIVKLCIKFHSIPLKGNLLKLPRDEGSYGDVLKGIRERCHKLKKVCGNKEFSGIIDKSYEKLRKETELHKINHPIVLAHGDICEQNIILHNGNLKLIDYESLGLTDPACEIAYIFTQFNSNGLNDEQRKTFLEEYLNLRKDKTLKERVYRFVPLKNFADLLWAVEYVFKIKNKQIHQHGLDGKDVKSNIDYAKNVFNKVIKDGTIDNKYRDFDLGKVFNEIF